METYHNIEYVANTGLIP